MLHEKIKEKDTETIAKVIKEGLQIPFAASKDIAEIRRLGIPKTASEENEKVRPCGVLLRLRLNQRYCYGGEHHQTCTQAKTHRVQLNGSNK